MARIDYYFTTVSPFAYLAGNRLEEIAAKHGAEVAYKPLDLQALFQRTGGTPLPQRHESRKEYRLQDLRRRARRARMKINLQPRHWPTNPAPSSYAIIAAQKAGGGDLAGLVHGLLAACWANELDIAEDAVIRDCLAAAGFEPAIADRGMLASAETYAKNLEQAVAHGVFGSPFYVTEDDERFWGQDRLDDLDLHLAGEL